MHEQTQWEKEQQVYNLQWTVNMALYWYHLFSILLHNSSAQIGDLCTSAVCVLALLYTDKYARKQK